MRPKYTFWIFGSGRWAKIIAQQLQTLFDDEASLNFVSERGYHEIKNELKTAGINYFNILADLQAAPSDGMHFAIICGVS